MNRRGFLQLFGGAVAALATNTILPAEVLRQPRTWITLSSCVPFPVLFSNDIAGGFFGLRSDGTCFFSSFCKDISELPYNVESMGQSALIRLLQEDYHLAMLRMNEYLECDCCLTHECDKHRAPVLTAKDLEDLRLAATSLEFHQTRKRRVDGKVYIGRLGNLGGAASSISKNTNPSS